MLFASFFTCLLATAALASPPPARPAPAGEACEHFYERLGVGSRRVRLDYIRPELEDGRFALQEIPGYRPDAIYIGISNHRAEGPHHYYLRVGPLRLAGVPLYGAPIVKKNSARVAKGVLFEVVLPPEVAHAYRTRIQQGKVPRGMTCLHSLCSFLEAGGVVIHERGGARRVRTRVVAANLVEGKIKIRGKDADPATIRMLATGPEELENFLFRANTADELEKDAIKADIIYYGKRAGAAAFVVVVIAGAGYGAAKASGVPADR